MGFSDNFVWGAATSAYQIEGGVKGAGKGMHIWECVYKRNPERYMAGIQERPHAIIITVFARMYAL